MESSKRDMKERIWFVKYWVDYMKKNSNDVWSKQQADFINSVLRNANQDKELYLKVKEMAGRN